MPLARGIMNFGRLTIYRTTTTISNISPTTAICGDTVTFHVTVTNNIGGPTPTGGIVSIVNTTSGTILGTESLTAGVAVVITVPGISMGKYIAIYSGVHNVFESSTSIIANYNIGANNTAITVSTTSDLYFCHTKSAIITAQVIANYGPPPIGPVNFRLWSDSTNFIALPPGALDGYGNAESTISAYTTTDGYDYWLQALYDGYGCWNSSDTPVGTLGTILSPMTWNTITVITGPDSFCITASTEFDVIISSTSPSENLIGTIILEVLNRDGYGPALGPFDVQGDSSGTIVPITVPGHTTGGGNHTLRATFTSGNDTCYNGSVSEDFDVTLLDC